MKNPVETLVIDNFKGSMTSYAYGNINSGFSNVVQSSGQDPFTKPGLLTWMEKATQIDISASVITDLIMAGKSRVESGIVYVYAIGSAGRLYKIQVNDPTTYNPNYDNPVLLTTLSTGSPTFTRGGFMDFFGLTQKIYIGHDKGVTSINFDGTGEIVVGVAGSWTQTVPRPLAQFVGNLYAGNGSNLAEIIAGGTVSTYAKLSPTFPTGTQVRDLDVTPEGTYLQAVVTESALPNITISTPNTTTLGPSNSYVFKWNGTDIGYTSYNSYPAVVLSANQIFGNSQYVFGYDFIGGSVYNPTDKWITSLTTSAFDESPMPNGVVSVGNLMVWTGPLQFNGKLNALMCMFGSISGFEIQPGYWGVLFQTATSPETDVNRIPCLISISNFAQGTSFSGYSGNNIGSAKMYFSTIESSSIPTTKYRFYSWTPAPTGLGISQDSAVYQTQTQAFSKKANFGEIRIYGEPWIIGNEFTIDLIGSAGTPIIGGSKTFTAGTNLVVGNDYAWYTPENAPTYAVALRITNSGTTNFTINKVEIDWSIAGK